jgi:hypothetical protein
MVWVPGDVHDSRVREDGDPSRPKGLVERLFIYQMHPLAVIPDPIFEMIEDDLMGANPRNRGRYDAQEKRYKPDPRCGIDMIQWRLWQEYQCWGRPYWIIQGKNGGHKRKWHPIESGLSILAGGPKDPPIPGSLPFALPDERLWDQLAQWDTVRHAVDLLARYDQNPETVSDEEKEQMEPLKRVAAAWMEKQVDEATGWAGTGEAGVAFRLNDHRLTTTP